MDKNQSASYVLNAPRAPLFAACGEDDADQPSSSVSGLSNFQSSPLFPVSSQPTLLEETPAESSNENKNWSWLTNKSYSAGAQEAFHEFYNEEVYADVEDYDAIEEREVESGVAKKHTAKKDHLKKRKQSKKSRKRSPSPPSVEDLQRELLVKNSKKIFIGDIGLKPEDAFHLDRKADRSNLGCNMMYNAFVARYYSRWKSSALGGKFSNDFKRNVAARRYYSRKNAKVLKDESDVLDYANYHLIYDQGKFQKKILSSGSYVPLEISLNELKRDSVFDDVRAVLLGSASSEEEGKFPPVPKKVTYAEQIKQKTVAFNQDLREYPHDVDKWLEFMKFQDEVFLHPDGIVAEFGKVTERTVMEKKLSIIDHALEKNPKSVKLFLIKLELCKDYWEMSQLKKEWKRFTFIHPNNVDVWEAYLTFLQSKFSQFSVSNVTAGFVKCFSTLINILEGKFQSHDCPADLQERMLSLLTRFCQFLHQSGYSERALATYQALIEFNFFKPDTLPEMERKDLLAFFEPFWDSGMPRFGEAGSVGWAQVMQMKQFQEQQDENKIESPDEEENAIVQMKLAKHETWLKIEKLRQHYYWLPWRAGLDDNVECEDPDRMVLFDDVSPFLFHLTDDKHKFILLRNFLNYLDVINDPHYVTFCQRNRCHSPEFVEKITYPWVRHDYFKYKFSKNSSSLPRLLVLDDGDHQENYKSFVKNVVNKCIQLVPEPFSTEFKVLEMQHRRMQLMSQQVVLKQSLKELKKSMKDLLKEPVNRNNLHMWYEYVKVEKESGGDTRKMLETLLQCHSQSSADADDHLSGLVLFKFYRTLVETENCDKLGEQRQTSLMTLVGANERYGTKTTPSMILKARHHYQTTLSKLLEDYINGSDDLPSKRHHFLSTCDSALVEWVTCYALFQYLTLDIHPACIVYETVIEKLQNLVKETADNTRIDAKMDLEKIFMEYVNLLLKHINNKPSSLKLIRTVLNRALAAFPENPLLLHLLINLESRSHIAGRLRRYFNHRVLLTPSALSSFYSLLAEMHRRENMQASYKEFLTVNPEDSSVVPLADDGIVNRIASVFESASRSPACNNCPLLWRLYIAFEAKRGNLKKAKLIFYQAVQQCPWVKSLYVDAVETFPEDIQEILDVMTEKGIRVRIPIEEVELLMGLETTLVKPTELQDSTDPDIAGNVKSPETITVE